MRILAISGSLQEHSANLTLLQTAVAAAPPGVDIIIFDGLRALPHFDPDLETDQPPPAVQAWRQALAESDALLIASPEYAFSLPGALENGIDWVIGSAELDRKVVAITASVNHEERGHHGLKASSEPLTAANARIVGGEPIVRGPSFESDVAALLRSIVTALLGEPTAHVDPL